MGLKQSQTLEFTFNIKYLFGFMTYEIPVLTFKIKSNKSCKFICNKIQTLEVQNILNDWRRVSFHKAWNKSTLLNEREALTELRVICRIMEEANLPDTYYIPILSEPVTKVWTVVLTWFKSQTSILYRVYGREILKWFWHWKVRVSFLQYIYSPTRYTM